VSWLRSAGPTHGSWAAGAGRSWWGPAWAASWPPASRQSVPVLRQACPSLWRCAAAIHCKPAERSPAPRLAPVAHQPSARRQPGEACSAAQRLPALQPPLSVLSSPWVPETVRGGCCGCPCRAADPPRRVKLCPRLSNPVVQQAALARVQGPCPGGCLPQQRREPRLVSAAAAAAAAAAARAPGGACCTPTAAPAGASTARPRRAARRRRRRSAAACAATCPAATWRPRWPRSPSTARRAAWAACASGCASTATARRASSRRAPARAARPELLAVSCSLARRAQQTPQLPDFALQDV